MIIIDPGLILPDLPEQPLTKAQLKELISTLRAEVAAAQEGESII